MTFRVALLSLCSGRLQTVPAAPWFLGLDPDAMVFLSQLAKIIQQMGIWFFETCTQNLVIH